MRVLVSTGLFYPAQIGGPANTLYWLSKALVRAGIDVSAVVTNHSVDSSIVPFDKWYHLEGVRIRYCSKSSPFGLRQVYWAFREMRNCDVVMLSSVCYLPNLMVYILASLSEKRIIWSPRGELFDSAINNSWQKKLYFACLNQLLSKRVVIHATSEQEKALIHSFFPRVNDIPVIPNYIELPKREERRTPEHPYFIYVGRINPIKALDNLIRGLSLSKRFQESDYRFFMVGPNQNGFRDYLISLSNELGIGSKISISEGLYGREKYEAYANATFSFLVSHSENFGNVVIESLSQGTPVVASKGTPWEQLQSEHAGFWIDNNPQSIANCVDSILSLSADEYKHMRQSAETLARMYDVYTNIGSWLKLLQTELQ